MPKRVSGSKRSIAARAVVETLASLAVLLALTVSATVAQREPYANGELLEEITLEDQHGQKRTVDASVRIVVFTRDMDAGAIVRDALSDASADASALERVGAVYVSDISAMPSMVARLIAVPRMRKRPYPMLLDRRGEATRRLPAEAGAATILRLDARHILEVEHVDTPAGVVRALGIEPDEARGSSQGAEASEVDDPADAVSPAEPPVEP